ncbi:conserved hypothetical protein [Xanthomonas phaseoli pv. phaseoli]|uniref:Uncharacterized protein n=1 Tax=Xanthomonas campestris pv. phaseoli TaxID=317013 RepID=A0AB38E6T7_XANCH|nr:conserved hypothetical protein [Xanthomonas phaseoli pv. phaseoli]SON91173.1 conserved hypothetical protein [Xanthomonas phaseoli pv. phaseoli]SON92830.1 conserved hypothetical protein [Xanthomonas phaseoli pv. phaseoli]SOO29797.1 conserved hypothetical protein [Xanthomonas phaseoli pv. phaseoli]
MAGTDNSAPPPQSASACGGAPALPMLPAPLQDPSLRIERGTANAPVTTQIAISPNASHAAPPAAPARKRELPVGKPQPGASRNMWSPPSATRTATQQAQQQRKTGTREQMHRTVFLKLSASPSDRLADRGASWNTQTR